MPEKHSELNEQDRKKIGSSVDDVAESLVAMIRNGSLGAGDKLPPERDLAKTLGVSRPTLRAGIRALSTVGILRSRQGSGTFVAASNETQVLDGFPLKIFSGLNGFTQKEMAEAHQLLAIILAGLAAERAKEDQLKNLSKEISGMIASSSDANKYVTHEIGFYYVLAAASQNRVLHVLMNMLTTMIFGSEANPDPDDLDLDRENLAESYKLVYQTLSEQDVEEAKEAMRNLMKTRHAEES